MSEAIRAHIESAQFHIKKLRDLLVAGPDSIVDTVLVSAADLIYSVGYEQVHGNGNGEATQMASSFQPMPDPYTEAPVIMEGQRANPYRDPEGERVRAQFDLPDGDQPRRGGGRSTTAAEYGVALCPTCKMATPCNCDIVCSYCQAKKRKPCVSAYGKARDLAHVPRKMRIIGGQREDEGVALEGACTTCGMIEPCYCSFSCERCHAAPGEPCRTAGGNKAFKPHASRNHQAKEAGYT